MASTARSIAAIAAAPAMAKSGLRDRPAAGSPGPCRATAGLSDGGVEAAATGLTPPSSNPPAIAAPARPVTAAISGKPAGWRDGPALPLAAPDSEGLLVA